MRHRRRLAAALAALLLLTGCTAGQGTEGNGAESSTPVAETPSEPETPAFEWTVEDPADHGLDPAALERFHQALEGTVVEAAVTIRDGVIVDEYYADGYDADSTFPIHSASKSVTSALFGIALEEGYFNGVDDLLADYLPEVNDQADTRKQSITMRDLLTQTSGLEWYEWGSGYHNWEEFRAADNWVDYILSREMVAEPGAVFCYSTGNTHLIGAALERATGRGLMDYAGEKLFCPLGITSAEWGTDPQGIADAGNGLTMTARDAARFGQLFLQGGQWEGEQLVPADWVSASTTTQAMGYGDGTGSYGYQWWIRQMGAYDSFFAFGAYGQYIIVLPELDMVTVLTSAPGNSYTARNLMIDYLLPAVVE